MKRVKRFDSNIALKIEPLYNHIITFNDLLLEIQFGIVLQGGLNRLTSTATIKQTIGFTK